MHRSGGHLSYLDSKTDPNQKYCVTLEKSRIKDRSLDCSYSAEIQPKHRENIICHANPVFGSGVMQWVFGVIERSRATELWIMIISAHWNRPTDCGTLLVGASHRLRDKPQNSTILSRKLSRNLSRKQKNLKIKKSGNSIYFSLPEIDGD